MNPLWILVLVMPVIACFAVMCLDRCATALEDIKELLNEELEQEAQTPTRPPDCTFNLVSSRMCEHGTKGCDVRHTP